MFEAKTHKTHCSASIQSPHHSNCIRKPRSISSFFAGFKKEYIVNNPKKWNDDNFNPSKRETGNLFQQTDSSESEFIMV